MYSGIKNQFLRFTLNSLVLFLILFVIDRVAGNITNRFYFSQVAGANYRTTYSMDSTTADILVFGSSRASHHYVPEVFEDSLKMSFYNTGRDGNFLLFNTALFNAILKRYIPKIIILDINPGDLYYNKDDYDRLSSLLPYYADHPEIRSIVELRGSYEKYKLLSAIYPFNSCLVTIAIGNMEYNKIRKGDTKGYLPIYSKMKEGILKEYNNKIGEIDSTKLNALESIMKSCKSNNIRLVNVISPLYAKIEQNKTIQTISLLAEKYDADFLNYSNESIFLNSPGFFTDINHMNNDGAQYFSSILAHWIVKKKYEKKNGLN